MRPHHVAIVGSGPSGFFAAASLLKAADSSDEIDVAVDMLEMLPTPWGLVRSGVAPDHPKIKSISKQFENIAEDPRFRFFGNIVVGEHIDAAELADHYDAVVYAVGAQSDKSLNVPGEDLPGSIAAVDFVGWYNAHPNFQEMSPDLSNGRAVVVGNGNVALDVARILVTDPDELACTDIADHALESLRPCGMEEVVIIGRRGPLQTAFTTLELRELGELQGVDVVVDPAALERISDEEAAAAGKTAKQNIKVLRDYASRSLRPRHRRIVLRFFTSPIEIKGDGKVERIVLGRNELVIDDSGRVVAKDTGARDELPVQLVVRSVGYRGVPTPGLPFDEKTGTIPNTDGRVVGSRNEYVVGWIKRGPTGVIGTNKKDSQDTVDTLLRDLGAARDSGLADFPEDHADKLAEWLLSRQPKLVTEAHWQLIDRFERAAGEPHNRPRVKLPSLAELLRIGHGSIPARRRLSEAECMIEHMFEELATIDPSAGESALVERIAALERLKSAAAAGQARAAAALDAARRSAEAEAGVPAAQRGRGLASEIALARRDSPARGSRHLGFAKALMHEMPHTLAALECGMLSEWRATLIVRESACLDVEDRRTLDAELCGNPADLDGMGDARVAAAARAIAYRLDPHALVERAAKAEAERTVTIRPAPDTMTYLTALLPVAQGVSVYAALRREADTTFDGRSRGQVMADTLVQRVTGRSAATATPIAVNLVLSDETLLGGASEPAEVCGYGPIPAAVARDLVSSAVNDRRSRATLRRLYAHPRSGALVALESRARLFPRGLATFIGLRDQRCRTPYCDAPIRHRDHAQPHAHDGPTSAVNGLGACERCNYVKEAAGWQVVSNVDELGRHTAVFSPPSGGHYRSTAPPRTPTMTISELEVSVGIALARHAA